MRAFAMRFTLVASRCLTVAVAAVSLVVGSAVVTSATDASVELPVMYFSFIPGPTSHTICGNGELRAPPSPNPTWSLTAAGTRLGGTPITGSASAAGPSATVCVDVTKAALAGEYTVVFRYLAIANDAPSQIVAQVVWSPGTDGEIVATEQ